MKMFLLKLGMFSLLLLIADIALGGFFKLYDYAKAGEIHKIHSIMTIENADLVIMGSSRASHHYHPDIIRDSVGVNSVFNAGLDGQGTVISYAFFLGLSSRKTPQYIICEITPQFDILDQVAPSYSILNPYIGINGIRDIITDFDSTEKLKLASNAYKLNSALFRLIPSILIKRNVLNRGFDPLYGNLKEETKKRPVAKSQKRAGINTKKVEILRTFISEAQNKGIKLIFTISPVYGGDDLAFYSDEIKILNEYGVPILNHLNDARFVYNKEYYQDKAHLNSHGATEYSKIIAQEINAILRR